MEYTVINNMDKWELVKMVNGAIAQGWTVQGGVSVAYHYSGSVLYAQALVREKTQ